ncbi:MAG TPA: hypothetical protein VGR02_13985 [Thermoanaerobaculia bacterium]|jgi:hypothetical protein|nr:hypothetical protein [Thermoanaerobaculia bacterium]
MSTVGTYSFLPWLRHGLANRIAGGVENVRATIHVDLELHGTPVGGGDDRIVNNVQRDVALFGPGDIVGIEQRAIVRVEPRNWITNYESNYLPYIEFYDEDFAWRYTPAPPDPATGRLLPWLALVVLEESEFTEGKNVRDKPLPFLDLAVAPALVMPSADQLWAWAHVHVSRPILGAPNLISNDPAVFIPGLEAVLAENPDLACSRVVCPRKLEPSKSYHAFLIPSFESGRRAGLGLDPAHGQSVTLSAWAQYGGRPAPASFPYYYRWHFQTGTAGDFESLVRLLQPREVDHRVGTRDMDVQSPGLGIRGLDKPELEGVLRLGGALQVPESSFQGDEKTEHDRHEQWAAPFPRPIQEDLARRINLADDYDRLAPDVANGIAGIADRDPVITLPLYGRWPALTKRLRTDAPPNWIHELNLDPRFRVAAGFGTRVVQENQEKYMDAAWEQVGRVVEANRRIRFGQLARGVTLVWYDKHLQPLATVDREKGMLLLAPLNKRVLLGGATVHQQLLESTVQPAMTSAALRRAIRPKGRLARLVLPAAGGQRPRGTLLEKVSGGKVSAAPPRVTPPDIVTVDKVARELVPSDLPGFILSMIRKNPKSLLLRILLFLLSLFRKREHVVAAARAAEGLREENRTPQSVDKLPKSPDFTISTPESGVTPKQGASDSADAKNFKAGLKDAYTLIEASAAAAFTPPKKPLNIAAVVTGTVAAVDPAVTIPQRILGSIVLPDRIRAEIGEQFVEAMAYPEIDVPMYEPLKGISSELFLPHIDLIPQNSITLVETNQKFIEAYMVGLNHEFARELLWREYPTDQRGSYFRQFWDVRGYFDTEGLSPEALKEKLRDIPPLHRWSLGSALGEHDHRQAPGRKKNENEIVLVIRGELLKKYPTAVIYAHRARWQTKADGVTIDNTVERRLVELTPAQEDSPPRDIVKTPLYQAKIDPDIYFFGFDLTAPVARGGTGENQADDAGWFFVIKERPGEVHFGADLSRAAGEGLNVWNDLALADFQPAGMFIDVGNAVVARDVTEPPAADEKHPQWVDDQALHWNRDMSAADVAYILFQAPVLVGVHASEMLPR